jgi:hypothetical protein
VIAPKFVEPVGQVRRDLEPTVTHPGQHFHDAGLGAVAADRVRGVRRSILSFSSYAQVQRFSGVFRLK